MSLTDVELTIFFFALVSLLISAHCFGYVAQNIRIPRVIGEIFGGLLLGPTILGHFFPATYEWMYAQGKYTDMKIVPGEIALACCVWQLKDQTHIIYVRENPQHPDYKPTEKRLVLANVIYAKTGDDERMIGINHLTHSP